MARLMGETGEGHDSERHRLHVRLYLGIVKKVTICEKSDKLGGNFFNSSENGIVFHKCKVYNLYEYTVGNDLPAEKGVYANENMH